MRNRIISGLSMGVVVIEAPYKSGALITVTHANEQGREVFSVPGHADSFVSKGTNQLLREGAKLVENADDIIEELEPVLRGRINELKAAPAQSLKKKEALVKIELSEEELLLCNLISGNALHLDEIIEKTKLDLPKITEMIFNLQVKKVIKQLPGKQFIRN